MTDFFAVMLRETLPRYVEAIRPRAIPADRWFTFAADILYTTARSRVRARAPELPTRQERV